MSTLDTSKPLFSIILAFRNEAKFLESCLRSFDEQTISRDKWEIILVDGCSNDGSRQIAEDYVGKHKNAKLVDNAGRIARELRNEDENCILLYSLFIHINRLHFSGQAV